MQHNHTVTDLLEARDCVLLCIICMCECSSRSDQSPDSYFHVDVG